MSFYSEACLNPLALEEIINIVSADTKLSILKNKRNNFMKLQEKIEAKKSQARKDVRNFGMYDDCSSDYIQEEKEAGAHYELMKEVEEFLPADEVIEQSRVLKKLKKDFKTKYPESYEIMLSIVRASQVKREKIAQNSLKRKKIIYKSAANIVMALNGLEEELKNNGTPLDKESRERIFSVSSTTMLTFYRCGNPVKELPEHFRLHPDRVKEVASLAKDLVQLEMQEERKKLINVLLERIETAKI